MATYGHPLARFAVERYALPAVCLGYVVCCALTWAELLQARVTIRRKPAR